MLTYDFPSTTFYKCIKKGVESCQSRGRVRDVLFPGEAIRSKLCSMCFEHIHDRSQPSVQEWIEQIGLFLVFFQLVAQIQLARIENMSLFLRTIIVRLRNSAFSIWL